MAIDYGRKRVGIAVTDPGQMIATALTALPEHQVFTFLRIYMKSEQIEKFVVGKPVNLQNEATDATEGADKFALKLQKEFKEIAVERLDERFTSVLAQRAIMASGVKKKDRKNKYLTDEVSAVILLQSYLERRDFLKK